jgi:hypothetical protein
MRELNFSEVKDVEGGTYSYVEAAAMTVGLMALAPASVAVVTTGLVALTFYSVGQAFKDVK